jgi:5-methyltetrahydrofolate--homocysteine methyltransferase
LLIGGATTSAKHTAVKIAPQYDHPTVHVLDASRCVGVVDKLLSPTLRDGLVKDNEKLQLQLAESYRQRDVKLVPLSEARVRRFPTDWQSVDIPTPAFTGVKVLRDYPLAEIARYIDWSPFFLTWELKGKYPRIFDDPAVGQHAKELFADAQRLLERIIREKLLTANGVYGFWPAASEGDDIVLTEVQSSKFKVQGAESTLNLELETLNSCRLYTLRQQWERAGQKDFRALADYIAPEDSGRTDHLGAFAVTTGLGCDELCRQFDKDHDDYNSIMTKALADRLAEAFAELVHQNARRDWGYGRDEKLTSEQLIDEAYRGIRPAPGYPSQPDHTEKRTIFDLLQAEENTGLKLTETYAMWPAASVCGLLFAHPQARYFALDRITREQALDYARRKGMPLAEIERWLGQNLGYEP